MGPALESPGFNPPLRQITPHPRWRKEPEKNAVPFLFPFLFQVNRLRIKMLQLVLRVHLTFSCNKHKEQPSPHTFISSSLTLC